MYTNNFLKILSRISSILFFIQAISILILCINFTNLNQSFRQNRPWTRFWKVQKLLGFSKLFEIFPEKFSRSVERACVLLSYTGFMKNPMLARASDDRLATDRLIPIVLPEEYRRKRRSSHGGLKWQNSAKVNLWTKINVFWKNFLTPLVSLGHKLFCTFFGF